MRDGWKVPVKSGLVFAGVCIATLTLDRVLSQSIHDKDFRRAIAFSAIQILAIFSITVYLIGQRAFTRARTSIDAQIHPAIQDRVMALALAGESWSTAVPKRGPARRALNACLGHALAGLKASSRHRLAQFALQQGFSKQWHRECRTGATDERKRAISLIGLVSSIEDDTDFLEGLLLDHHPEIRVEAARALLVEGNPAMVEKVFRSVLSESLLSRVLLTNDLKRHARQLLAEVVPSTLSGNATAIEKVNCLQILTVWKLAIPSLDIADLLGQWDVHSNQAVFAWPLAAALLPYVLAHDSVEVLLVAALKSPDIEIQCAAAQAAGQLKLSHLVPALTDLLHANTRLAVAAATSLAQMGECGVQNLEASVSGTDRKAAAVAMEALESLTVGSV